MRVWRLTTRQHATTAFSGLGNRKVGSRWVPAGYSAVYTSESLSLATLETLVHIDPRHFKNNFVKLWMEIPEGMEMETLQVEFLPKDWREAYEDHRLQAIGQDWIERAENALLVVPSDVVPEENNIIINPLHPDFTDILVGPPELFAFDGRLMT
ncbi:MAG: RES family NAD+ phosphorylase [Candidatus Thiodiazotropha sp.]